MLGTTRTKISIHNTAVVMSNLRRQYLLYLKR